MDDELKQHLDRMESRLASIDERLKARTQHGEYEAMARFSEFSETAEARWVDLAVRVAAIEERLRKRDAGEAA